MPPAFEDQESRGTSDDEARQEFSLVFTARPVFGEPTPNDVDTPAGKLSSSPG
ncbi:hypothetical protein [Nocardiopsis nanhaiensis]